MGRFEQVRGGRRRSPRTLALLVLALALLLLPAVVSASAQAGTLSGTISAQDADEAPAALAGATVTATAAGGSAPVASAVSDLLGGYLLTLPDGSYDVEVSAAGREPLTRRGVAVSGAARLDATLVPTGYGRLVGTVVDSDGDPVPEPSVDLIGYARTFGDAAGRFSLAVAAGGPGRSLQLGGGPAAASWSVETDADIVLAAGEQRELAVSVPPMTTLTARVLGEGDVPLEEVSVSLPLMRIDAPLGGGLTGTFSSAARYGVTDANGEFSGQVFDHAADWDWPIEAIPSREQLHFPKSQNPPRPIDGPTLVTLRLVRFGSLLLHLRDADGEPVVGEALTYRFTTLIDSDLDIRWLGGVRTVTVEGRALGGPPPWRFVTEHEFVGAAEETLRFPALAPTTIRVVDEHGDPIAGAGVVNPKLDVAAGPAGLPGTLTIPAQIAAGYVTDANGEVTFDAYAGMTADPAVPGVVTPPSGRGYEPEVRYTVTSVGGTTTVVVPQHLVHVDGTVVDPDGDPVAGARFVFGPGYETTTLGDGSFAIDVPEGTEGFTLSAADARFVATEPLFDDDTTLTLRLPRPVQLTVDVTGDGGRPLAGANVNLVPLSVYRIGIGGGLEATASTAARDVATDAAGTARFAVFPGSRRGFGSRGITVTGPAGTSYIAQRPPLPDFDGDEEVAVRLLRPAPVIAFAPTPAPAGGSGDWWSVSRVAVAVTATDPDGVASLACTVDGVARRFAQTTTPTTRAGTVNVSGEGRHLLACASADAVGDLSDGERRVWIDRHKPAKPSLAPDRAADSANGWWRDAVTVTASGAGDPLLADGSAGSGVDPASVPAPVTYDSSGRFVASATVADRAGNVSAVARATVRVDADAPTSTLTCPAGPVRAGSVAYARWHDADGESGVAGSVNGRVALDTATPGRRTAEHVAADRVGHETTSSCTYEVV